MPQDPVTPDSGATGNPPGSTAPSTLLHRAVEAWRRELTELAGPDTLLQYRDLPLGTLDLGTAHPSGLASFLAGRPTRLSDLFREQTALDVARDRARHLRIAAARLTDGYGLPGSELAVGMVEWVDVDGKTPVAAPVLLRPLTLRPRGSGAVDFDLDLDGPPRLNPALLALLARHGSRVDAVELLRLAGDDHDFTPRRVLDRLRGDLARFGGARDRLGDGTGDGGGDGVDLGPVVHDWTVVGLFADLGPALVDDLARVTPDLSRHRFVQTLLGAGSIGTDRASTTAGPVRAPREGELTPLDPSQRAVVEAVARGRDLRVEAPVGSGATQVAAQLVVDAARTGRSVLVVAPRRGPLDDVVARLVEHGLGRLLPVATAADPDGPDLQGSSADGSRDSGSAHSGSAHSGSAHSGSHAGMTPAEELAARRALHEVRPRWGTSRIDVLHALVRLAPAGGSPSAPDVLVLPEATLRALAQPAARDEATQLLTEGADVDAYAEISTSSPWVGAAVESVEEAEQVLEAVDRLREGLLHRARHLMDGLAHGVGLRSGQRVRDWGHQLDLFVSVRSTLDTFLPAVYERALDVAVAATASTRWRAQHGVEMSRTERRRWRRQATELVRPGMKPGDLHAELVAAAAERERWQRISGSGAHPHVPGGLGMADSVYEQVLADLSMLEAVLEGTAGAAGLEELTLDALVERLDVLAAARDDLAVLPRRTSVLSSLDHLGLAGLVEQLRAEEAGRDLAATRLEIAWHQGVLAAMDAEDRGLASPGEYGRRAEARATAHPSAGPRPSALGVTALALPYLPVLPDRVDTVLLLEAQKLGLAEAVAPIARGSQVVVVGNPDGLRPASLDALEEEVEHVAPQRTSVLDATMGRLATMTLDHRHRSPEQVVAIGQSLVAGVGPLPRWQVAAPDGLVARLDVVADGTVPVTASPAEASPPQEVQRVVDLVLDHARERPDQSLAVLAPGRGHARAVADAVRRGLAAEPGLTSWFTRASDEPFVVADLARAEDTVRDHVLLSLGIGRTPHGRVVHRFGRLDDDEGDRLLALGVAQARLRLTVVTSLTADQLDPERTTSDGARALRRLLQVLAVDAGAPTAGQAPLGPAPEGDEVLDLLVDALRDAGHEVGSQEASTRAEGPAADEELDLDFGPAPLRRNRSGRRPATTTRPGGVPRSDPTTHPDLVVRVRGGRRPVAVLWDGRRPADDPTEVVSGDRMLAAALERFGWGVARVRAADVVADPAAAAAQVASNA